MLWRRHSIRRAALLAAGFLFGIVGALAPIVETPAAAGPQTAPAAAPDGSLSLQPILTTGLSNPVLLTHAGDGSHRMFIVEQAGRIRVVKNGALLSTAFLDISASVVSGGEQGLLGLAFHPHYATNGRFFVFYTKKGSTTGVGDNVLAEYRASPPGSDQAVATPVRTLFSLPDRFTNHNAGMLGFGQDGYLYVSTGDEGNGGDPDNNAQNLGSMFGKIHRLDVDNIPNGQPYGIPPGNPFVGQAGALPSIWTYGLRNPWRWSFDRQTGDQWIGDVGQGAWEEIDLLPKGLGGINFGWRDREGRHCFQPATGCATAGRADPILEYSHDFGCSVTGGYVYRGSAFPALQGQYFYADYCSGRIWRARSASPGVWTSTEALDTALQPSSFGEDENGELYLVDLNGGIYRIWDANAVPACEGAAFGAIAPASPQATGTNVSVTASANARGGATCEYRFWMLPPGGQWSVAQEWTTTPTFTYRPLGPTPGTYMLGLWARAANQGPDTAISTASSSYTLAAPSCDGAQLSAGSPPSPQATGTNVSVTASATPHLGATCEYRFWLLPPGGQWTVAQEWTTAPAFTFSPLGTVPGVYTLSIWARAANQAPDTPVTSAVTQYTLAAPTCDDARISAISPPSPQATATNVSVTASAAPHVGATCEYRFWRLVPGGSWTVVQEWTTNPTFTYTPLGTVPGQYAIGVWARASGQGANTTTTSDVRSYTLSGSDTGVRPASASAPDGPSPTATVAPTPRPLPTPPPTGTPTPTAPAPSATSTPVLTPTPTSTSTAGPPARPSSSPAPLTPR